MFNFLKKEFKPLSEYSKDCWSILEQKDAGLIIRINAGLKDAISHPDYPVKIGIAVPVKNDPEQTFTQKDQLEKMVGEILGEDGIVTCVINGMKEPQFFEFLVYAKNGLNLDLIGKSLEKEFPDLGIQMYAKLDPKWETYKSFITEKL